MSETLLALSALPGAALHIGMAINPADPPAGLARAIELAGIEKVRAVADVLQSFNGRPASELVDILIFGWSSCTPLGSAIPVLRAMQPSGLVALVAASMIAKSAPLTFSTSILSALAPGARLLAGLPTAREIDAAADTTLRDWQRNNPTGD